MIMMMMMMILWIQRTQQNSLLFVTAALALGLAGRAWPSRMESRVCPILGDFSVTGLLSNPFVLFISDPVSLNCPGWPWACLYSGLAVNLWLSCLGSLSTGITGLRLVPALLLSVITHLQVLSSLGSIMPKFEIHLLRVTSTLISFITGWFALWYFVCGRRITHSITKMIIWFFFITTHHSIWSRRAQGMSQNAIFTGIVKELRFISPGGSQAPAAHRGWDPSDQVGGLVWLPFVESLFVSKRCWR